MRETKQIKEGGYIYIYIYIYIFKKKKQSAGKNNKELQRNLRMFKDAGKNIGFFIICFLGWSRKKKKKTRESELEKKKERVLET